MRNRILFVYPWATLGGVERVLLNRALAFKTYDPTIKMDIFFIHDSGGLGSLKNAIIRYELSETVEIISSIDKNYDLASAIDCPQAIDIFKRSSQRYVVECHTSYAENRTYLGNLTNECEQVIAPSPFFRNLIVAEFPRLQGKVSVLRNFVPWDILKNDAPPGFHLPFWKRIPILFLGRMDGLKNPLELLEAYEIINARHPNKFMLLFCGACSPEINIEIEIERRNLSSCVVVLPPIPFASVGRLFESISRLGGIFVSPSKGESFGLSAAEAISSLVPVVLSNIEPHCSLVNGFESMLTYRLGDVNDLATKIESVFDNYEAARQAVCAARNSLSADAFINDWNFLLKKLKINA